ncbi:MAG: UDP-3-O-(3-hydroxymyristoyl)glucosamine N-acyltransferase [Bacteroidales bacterium]|nr:UDP-3-O-(3-hydroxymyristoyl)glucosamine N-acyltransferase [Bacteroidales bacterium]
MKLLPPLTIEEVAGFLNASFDGDPSMTVSGINEIHMVEEGDLTFVDHPKYYDKALQSSATTILINKNLTPPDGKALIFSKDPFSDYVKLIKKHRSFCPSESNISPSAVIEEGTVIQPGCFIGNNVKIGKNCIIHSNVSIYDHCVVGNNVIIHSNSVIGADAYYFQRKNDSLRKLDSCGTVHIEDDVEIGALCSIDRGVSAETRIGKGTKLDNHVQIGHDTSIGKNCLIGAQSAIAGVTCIEDNVIIWACVIIDKDLVIGNGAIILASSGVSKSLEGNKIYFGSPAEEVRKRWKEIAIIRKLPEIYESLRKKDLI